VKNIRFENHHISGMPVAFNTCPERTGIPGSGGPMFVPWVHAAVDGNEMF